MRLGSIPWTDLCLAAAHASIQKLILFSTFQGNCHLSVQHIFSKPCIFVRRRN